MSSSEFDHVSKPCSPVTVVSFIPIPKDSVCSFKEHNLAYKDCTRNFESTFWPCFHNLYSYWTPSELLQWFMSTFRWYAVCCICQAFCLLLVTVFFFAQCGRERPQFSIGWSPSDQKFQNHVQRQKWNDKENIFREIWAGDVSSKLRARCCHSLF